MEQNTIITSNHDGHQINQVWQLLKTENTVFSPDFHL